MSETPHNILLLRATAYTWYHYSYYCCSFCFPPRYAGGGGGWGAAKGRQAVAGRQTDRRWSGAVLGSSLFLFLQGLCCSFVCMIYMYSHLPHHLFADHYSSMYWQTCRIPSCDWLMGLDVFMLLSDWYTCRYIYCWCCYHVNSSPKLQPMVTAQAPIALACGRTSGRKISSAATYCLLWLARGGERPTAVTSPQKGRMIRRLHTAAGVCGRPTDVFVPKREKKRWSSGTLSVYDAYILRGTFCFCGINSAGGA